MSYLPEVFVGPLRIGASPAAVDVLFAETAVWVAGRGPFARGVADSVGVGGSGKGTAGSG